MKLFGQNHTPWLIAAGFAGRATTGFAELIPTPTFTDHPIPTAVPSLPGSTFGPWLDVVVLLAALAAATYLTLVARSRRLLVLLTVASVAWFGFYRQGCVCPIGATQNVALALVDTTYVIPVTVVAIFLLPLVFALFFGRTFCSAVCPLGAVQELVALRPRQLPRWVDDSLGLIPYLYLGIAVMFAVTGTGFLICRYDPFVAFFRRNGNTPMILFGGSLLLLGVFVGRPYCRFLCPYGALLRLVSGVSQWRTRITPGNCLRCRLCEFSCPYGAIRSPTVLQSPETRARGKRQLLFVLAIAPAVMGLSAWSLEAASAPLSQWHPQISLAEQLWAEESGVETTSTDASEAYISTGRPRGEQYRQAIVARDRFRHLGWAVGTWFGLVVSAKLVHLTVRRKRIDYEPDQSACVACGRCYQFCPVEQVRLGWIPEDSLAEGRSVAIQEVHA